MLYSVGFRVLVRRSERIVVEQQLMHAEVSAVPGLGGLYCYIDTWQGLMAAGRMFVFVQN